MKLVNFQRHPETYRHWHLTLQGEVARLNLNVPEQEGFADGYPLKLNSYDLGVDMELADSIQRL